MADTKSENLKSFDPYRDENGQNMGQDAPNEIANPGNLQKHLASDPGGEAETARLASGRPNQGADAATEAELPPGTVERLSNPSSGGAPAKDGAAGEAIERATASLGKAG